ncbi:MAG: hypothetical protein GTO03_00615, partial [Planctomycetales bacterium]|nr:hypothetical protein [Planctomycetales bacterium]
MAPPSLAPSAAVAELPHPWAWLRLPILLSLLLWGAEVAVLTPQFEFKAGAMRYVAHPLTANFVFLATVLFLLLAGDRLGGGNAWDRRTAPHRLAWLAVNLVSFALLWAVTLRLQGMAAGGPAYGGLVAAWGVLALTVGLTAWLAFLSARRLAAWLGDSW